MPKTAFDTLEFIYRLESATHTSHTMIEDSSCIIPTKKFNSIIVHNCSFISGVSWPRFRVSRAWVRWPINGTATQSTRSRHIARSAINPKLGCPLYPDICLPALTTCAGLANSNHIIPPWSWDGESHCVLIVDCNLFCISTGS